MTTKNNPMSPVTKEKIAEDLKVVSKDLQDLLKETASVIGEKATEARAKVVESLKVAQDKLSGLPETNIAKGKDAAAVTDKYVRDNPWNAVGVAVGLGLLLGVGLATAATLRSRE
jgi:ElaB/YqjD/DUF883 family membrane-anchored ribosome-binding protein